jgi:hypothetical protein
MARHVVTALDSKSERHNPLCPCQPSCFQLLAEILQTSAASLDLPEALFHARVFWLLDNFADGGGTTVPLSGEARWFVALRCSAEERVCSLNTPAQDHVWDLAEYTRVELAHCPTGATPGEPCGE